MTFTVVERTRLRHPSLSTIRLYPKSGNIVFPVALAEEVGINGHARVLWDEDNRMLAIESVSATDPNALKVRPEGPYRSQVSHKQAIRLAGVRTEKDVDGSIVDGRIVCAVGDPQWSE